MWLHLTLFITPSNLLSSSVSAFKGVISSVGTLGVSLSGQMNVSTPSPSQDQQHVEVVCPDFPLWCVLTSQVSLNDGNMGFSLLLVKRPAGPASLTLSFIELCSLCLSVSGRLFFVFFSISVCTPLPVCSTLLWSLVVDWTLNINKLTN